MNSNFKHCIWKREKEGNPSSLSYGKNIVLILKPNKHNIKKENSRVISLVDTKILNKIIAKRFNDDVYIYIKLVLGQENHWISFLAHLVIYWSL